MIVQAIKTDVVLPGGPDLFAVLDKALPNLGEGSIVAITSKIVSICEGRVAPKSADKEQLIIDESDFYMPSEVSAYGFHFTIVDNALIAMAGIDESNSSDGYVLYPKDPQATANRVREHLAQKHKIKKVGVIITDSTHRPMRRGSTGIALAHSGFNAIRDYIGKPDLFGRPFKVSWASVSGGLAAAAVVCMGEGREQTPLALITEVDSVEFQPRNPTKEEVEFLGFPLEEDMFAPFLLNAKWQPGKRRKP